MYNTNDVHEATNTFQAILKEEIDKATYTQIQSNHYNTIKTPWINNTLLKLIRRRDKLAYKSKKYPHDIRMKIKWKDVNKILKNSIRKAKRNYYKVALAGKGVNNSEYWKILRNCTDPILKDSKGIVNHFVTRKGYPVSANNKESANAINEEIIQSGIISQVNIEEALKHIPTNNTSAFFKPLTFNETIMIIKGLKINTAPGVDGIKSWVIKENNAVLAVHIMYIINKIFEEGIFPDSLKVIRITPIYKKGDKRDASNYRPISIITSIGKIVERAIYNRLNDYIIKNKLIAVKQHGYQKYKSTNSAISQLVHEILLHLENKEVYALCTIDFTKAFDTINHELLIKKLERFGIRGIISNLFKSFLENRKQYVVWDGEKSETEIILNGVPQGSALGGILFLIYTNDLPKNNENIMSYVDDTATGTGNKLIDAAILKTQKTAEYIEHWSNINGLKINEKKTELIIFCSHKADVYKEIRNKYILVNNTKIYPTKEIKYLGIYIDDELNWRKQINYVTNQIRKFIPIMHKVKNVLNVKDRRRIYKALIEPKILYNIDVWAATLSGKLDTLQRAQNIILRITESKPKRKNAKELYNETKTLNCYALHILTLYKSKWKQRQLTDTIANEVLLQKVFHQTKMGTRDATAELYRIPKYRTNYKRFHEISRLPIILNFLIKENEEISKDWEDSTNNIHIKEVTSILLEHQFEKIKRLF